MPEDRLLSLAPPSHEAPEGRVDGDREFMAGLSSAGRRDGSAAPLVGVVYIYAEAGQKVTMAPWNVTRELLLPVVTIPTDPSKGPSTDRRYVIHNWRRSLSASPRPTRRLPR